MERHGPFFDGRMTRPRLVVDDVKGVAATFHSIDPTGPTHSDVLEVDLLFETGGGARPWPEVVEPVDDSRRSPPPGFGPGSRSEGFGLEFVVERRQGLVRGGMLIPPFGGGSFRPLESRMDNRTQLLVGGATTIDPESAFEGIAARAVQVGVSLACRQRRIVLDQTRIRTAVEDACEDLRVARPPRSRGCYRVEGGESVGERYRLRKTVAGWRVFENRFWLLSSSAGGETLVYDAEHYAEVDRRVEAERAAGASYELAVALLDAGRQPEALETLRAVTEEDGEPYDWVLRGLAAAITGEIDDAKQSFANALALDPAAPVPSYAR